MGRKRRTDGQTPTVVHSRKRPNYHTDTRKGYYTLLNPQKYMFEGTTEVEYKSGWEKAFFPICDGNQMVTRWGYEPFDIPYHSPMLMKQSLYRPDVYLEIQYADGHMEKWLIEIKPVAYSVVPKAPKPPPVGCADPAVLEKFDRRMKAYQQKSLEVATNYAKWSAAEKWCQAHGINWFIANENNTRGLFGSH